MAEKTIGSITVLYPDNMPEAVVDSYVEVEKLYWLQAGRNLSGLERVVIEIDGDTVIIKPMARIVRTRRII
jgi:hypothetical protein